VNGRSGVKSKISVVVGRAPFFLYLAVTLGGISGCILARKLSEGETQSLADFLIHYLTMLGESEVQVHVWSLLLSRTMIWLFLLLVGFTPFGSFLVLPILYLHTGLMIFSVACFVCVFGLPGLLPALLLFGAPLMCFVPGLMVLGAWAIGCPDFRSVCGQIAVIVVCLMALVLCLFFDRVIVPFVLPKAANFVISRVMM